MSLEASVPYADSFLTVTFYRFVRLPDAKRLAAALRARCEALDIKGTVILAAEGINASIAGRAQALSALLQWLSADPRLAGLDCTALPCPTLPFRRLKVRIKPEVVTFGQGDLSPEAPVGIAIAPSQWNALLDTVPGLVLVDTRNAFEVAAGSFTGAVDPGIAAFSELPQWIEQQRGSDGALSGEPPVAMFCTGGIRCEKSTAYLRAQGFGEVYQLHGGILRYLAAVPAAESRWHGDCFVFDERISVGQDVQT